MQRIAIDVQTVDQRLFRTRDDIDLEIRSGGRAGLVGLGSASEVPAEPAVRPRE